MFKGGHFILIARKRLYKGRARVRMFHNSLTTEGATYCVGASLKGSAQTSSWYVGLINNSSFSALAAGDTMSSHSGWTEWTSYDEANRQAWTLGSVSSGIVSNADSPAVFTMSAAGTLRGAFISSNNTKGGTTGTMLAHGLCPVALDVADDEAIQVLYHFTGAGG